MKSRHVVAALAILVATVAPARATHLAGISITAIHANGLTVDLESSLATVNPGYYGGYYPFAYLYVYFGDGFYRGNSLPLVSGGAGHPPSIFAGAISHTYAAPGTFTAHVESCCANTTIFGAPTGGSRTTGFELTDTTTFSS